MNLLFQYLLNMAMFDAWSVIVNYIKKKKYKNCHRKDGTILLKNQNNGLVWTNLCEYSSLTVVNEENKNVEKLFGKVLTNCPTLLSSKRNRFVERYDKSNDWIRL